MKSFLELKKTKKTAQIKSKKTHQSTNFLFIPLGSGSRRENECGSGSTAPGEWNELGDNQYLEYSGNLFGICPDNISLRHTAHVKNLKKIFIIIK